MENTKKKFRNLALLLVCALSLSACQSEMAARLAQDGFVPDLSTGDPGIDDSLDFKKVEEQARKAQYRALLLNDKLEEALKELDVGKVNIFRTRKIKKSIERAADKMEAAFNEMGIDFKQLEGALAVTRAEIKQQIKELNLKYKSHRDARENLEEALLKLGEVQDKLMLVREKILGTVAKIDQVLDVLIMVAAAKDITGILKLLLKPIKDKLMVKLKKKLLDRLGMTAWVPIMHPYCLGYA